jgi:hypothetical protein
VSAVGTRVDSSRRPRVTHLPSAPEFPTPHLAPRSSPLSRRDWCPRRRAASSP